MRFAAWFVSAAVALASAAGAAPYDEEGFRLTPAELLMKVKRICLREPAGDLPREVYASRMLWLEQFIAAQLARSELESVPSQRTEAALAEARKRAGGMHDAFTGRVMPAKREAVLAAERSALVELGCDATLAPEIHVVRLRWEEGVASWDHVRHSLGGGRSYLGTALGISLWLELRAISGEALLERAGGIQSLSTLEGGTVFDPKWHDARPENLLGSGMWNARAVIAALGALAPAPTPEVAQCIAAATKNVDAQAQRAQCEAEAFAFVPPADPEKSQPDASAPAPKQE